MKKGIFLLSVMVLTAVIVFTIMACGSNDTCSHKWLWVETKPATLAGNPPVETEGEETKTCSICKKTDSKRPFSFTSYFYGTWENNLLATREISTTKIIFSGSDFSFELINLTFTTETNTIGDAENYPNGFIIKGIIANKTGIVSGIPENGEAYSHTCFLHTNKGSYIQVGSNTTFYKVSK